MLVKAHFGTVHLVEWLLDGSWAYLRIWFRVYLIDYKLLNCWLYWELHINPSNAKATFVQSTRTQRFLENHLNPVLLVFIGKLLLSTLRWVPMCQGFDNFSGSLLHFVLVKLATSSVRVNKELASCSICNDWNLANPLMPEVAKNSLNILVTSLFSFIGILEAYHELRNTTSENALREFLETFKADAEKVKLFQCEPNCTKIQGITK